MDVVQDWDTVVTQFLSYVHEPDISLPDVGVKREEDLVYVDLLKELVLEEIDTYLSNDVSWLRNKSFTVTACSSTDASTESSAATASGGGGSSSSDARVSDNDVDMAGDVDRIGQEGGVGEDPDTSVSTVHKQFRSLQKTHERFVKVMDTLEIPRRKLDDILRTRITQCDLDPLRAYLKGVANVYFEEFSRRMHEEGGMQEAGGYKSITGLSPGIGGSSSSTKGPNEWWYALKNVPASSPSFCRVISLLDAPLSGELLIKASANQGVGSGDVEMATSSSPGSSLLGRDVNRSSRKTTPLTPVCTSGGMLLQKIQDSGDSGRSTRRGSGCGKPAYGDSGHRIPAYRDAAQRAHPRYGDQCQANPTLDTFKEVCQCIKALGIMHVWKDIVSEDIEERISDSVKTFCHDMYEESMLAKLLVWLHDAVLPWLRICYSLPRQSPTLNMLAAQIERLIDAPAGSGPDGSLPGRPKARNPMTGVLRAVGKFPDNVLKLIDSARECDSTMGTRCSVNWNEAWNSDETGNMNSEAGNMSDACMTKLELEWYRHTKQILVLFLDVFIQTRISQAFDIVKLYPDSESALLDLKAVLQPTHVDLLISSLTSAFEKRLLVAGVETKGIILAYCKVVRAMKVLEETASASSNVKLLDAISTPIKIYLQRRKDTVRCIVSSLTEEGGPLQAEYAKSNEQEIDLEDDFSDDDINEFDQWKPDLLDATTLLNPSTKKRDLIHLLVSIYGSRDLFINEYKELLAQKLLTAGSYDTSTQRKNLEQLKTRFGEQPLQIADVMLTDVLESRRLYTNVLQRRREAAEGNHQNGQLSQGGMSQQGGQVNFSRGAISQQGGQQAVFPPEERHAPNSVDRVGMLHPPPSGDGPEESFAIRGLGSSSADFVSLSVNPRDAPGSAGSMLGSSSGSGSGIIGNAPDDNVVLCTPLDRPTNSLITPNNVIYQGQGRFATPEFQQPNRGSTLLSCSDSVHSRSVDSGNLNVVDDMMIGGDIAHALFQRGASSISANPSSGRIPSSSNRQLMVQHGNANGNGNVCCDSNNEQGNGSSSSSSNQPLPRMVSRQNKEFSPDNPLISSDNRMDISGMDISGDQIMNTSGLHASGPIRTTSGRIQLGTEEIGGSSSSSSVYPPEDVPCEVVPPPEGVVSEPFGEGRDEVRRRNDALDEVMGVIESVPGAAPLGIDHQIDTNLDLTVMQPILMSYQFWPFENEIGGPLSTCAADSSGPERLVPTEMQRYLDEYTGQYSRLKSTRKLEWHHDLGSVEFELELNDSTVTFTVPPSVAAVLYPFLDEGFSISSLATHLDIPEDITRQKLQFWFSQEVLKDSGGGIFELNESFTPKDDAVSYFENCVIDGLLADAENER